MYGIVAVMTEPQPLAPLYSATSYELEHPEMHDAVVLRETAHTDAMAQAARLAAQYGGPLPDGPVDSCDSWTVQPADETGYGMHYDDYDELVGDMLGFFGDFGHRGTIPPAPPADKHDAVKLFTPSATITIAHGSMGYLAVIAKQFSSSATLDGLATLVGNPVVQTDGYRLRYLAQPPDDASDGRRQTEISVDPAALARHMLDIYAPGETHEALLVDYIRAIWSEDSTADISARLSRNAVPGLGRLSLVVYNAPDGWGDPTRLYASQQRYPAPGRPYDPALGDMQRLYEHDYLALPTIEARLAPDSQPVDDMLRARLRVSDITPLPRFGAYRHCIVDRKLGHAVLADPSVLHADAA